MKELHVETVAIDEKCRFFSPDILKVFVLVIGISGKTVSFWIN
jgi:hypothetical protein